MWKTSFKSQKIWASHVKNRVASQSFQKTNYRLRPIPDSQKEWDYSEDVLTDQRKVSESQGEDLGQNSTASCSGVSDRERKYRGHSVGVSDEPGLHLERTSNLQPSYSMSSLVEISLENSKLCEDLSDSIEQSLQRTSETKSKTQLEAAEKFGKRRRARCGFRFRRLLPPRFAEGTKRRTVGTLDSRGLEPASSRQDPCTLPSTSSEENGEGFTAPLAASFPGKRRRRSFIPPHLPILKVPPSPRGCKRDRFSAKRERTRSKRLWENQTYQRTKAVTGTASFQGSWARERWPTVHTWKTLSSSSVFVQPQWIKSFQ